MAVSQLLVWQMTILPHRLFCRSFRIQTGSCCLYILRTRTERMHWRYGHSTIWLRSPGKDLVPGYLCIFHLEKKQELNHLPAGFHHQPLFIQTKKRTKHFYGLISLTAITSVCNHTQTIIKKQQIKNTIRFFKNYNLKKSYKSVKTISVWL